MTIKKKLLLPGKHKAVKNVAEMIKAFEAQRNTNVSIIVFRNQQQKKLD